MNLETLHQRQDTNHVGGNFHDLTNINVLENISLLDGSPLDKSQMKAIMRILRKKVAIVQGPPGTGKTFVSVAAILVMLKNWQIGEPPIVVSAPRNEAEIFFEHGLLTKSQFDRISNDGWTRSEEEISDFQIWLKTSQEPPPSTPPLGDRFYEDEDTGYEALGEQEMETRKARDDDEMEALKGRYYEYRRNFVSKYKTKRSLESQVPAILSKFPNLEDVPDDWRGAVYQYLKNEVSKKVQGEFREHMKLYCRIAEDLKVAKWEQNVKLVRNLNIKLIGCTTTGLSNDGEHAIRDLNGKAFESRILKVLEFQEEIRETFPRSRLALTRIRSAKSLGNLRNRGRRQGRRPATPEAHGTKEQANSWPRNPSVVSEAGAVTFIPEIPSALDPPPGVPSKPDLTQPLLDNRPWASTDGMGTVADGTEVRTVIGDSHRNWRPATAMARMRKVLQLDEDLIDFGSDKENEKEGNMLTLSTVAKVKAELSHDPPQAL